MFDNLSVISVYWFIILVLSVAEVKYKENDVGVAYFLRYFAALEVESNNLSQDIKSNGSPLTNHETQPSISRAEEKEKQGETVG